MLCATCVGSITSCPQCRKQTKESRECRLLNEIAESVVELFEVISGPLYALGTEQDPIILE